MDILKQSFDDFEVFSYADCNSFVHINITNSKLFYSKMFEYFFDESRLLRYIENKASISFQPTPANFIALYKKLKIFIDEENCVQDLPNIEKDLLDIVSVEHTIIEEKGIKKVRLDKIGKIGEYIFSNILSEYFGFQCVIPKLNMATSHNMSVYGIDTIFYSHEKKFLLFGESKVSKSVNNGIDLINKSLSTYQSQIDNDFNLILSNRMLKDKMGYFEDDFGDKVEMSLKMSTFIKKASIKNIGIPIFIAHGGSETTEEIFEKLKRIKRVSFYGIKTNYIIISLPLIDKDEFVKSFTLAIAERRDFYESIAS